jgi:hypothetical protein
MYFFDIQELATNVALKVEKTCDIFLKSPFKVTGVRKYFFSNIHFLFILGTY